MKELSQAQQTADNPYAWAQSAPTDEVSAASPYGNAAAMAGIGSGAPSGGGWPDEGGEQGAAPWWAGDEGESHTAIEPGGAALGASSKEKEGAVQHHQDNLAAVKGLVDEALAAPLDPLGGADSEANLLRNSVEWLTNGQATLFVLSPTHDSAVRPSVGRHQLAFFDARVPWGGTGATYDDTLDEGGRATNDEGLKIADAYQIGGMSADGKSLTLYDPLSISKTELKSTLIHEVQHDADQSDEGERWAVPADGGSGAAYWNLYQSEFRAYWLESPEGTPGDHYPSAGDPALPGQLEFTVGGEDGEIGTPDDFLLKVPTGFQNARQQAIFLSMIEGVPRSHVSDLRTYLYWYALFYYVIDAGFRAMVDGFARPTSGNVLNSVRIQALSDAIENGSMDAIRAAVDGLDALDRAWLGDRSNGGPLFDRAKVVLSATDYAELEQLLGRSGVQANAV